MVVQGRVFPGTLVFTKSSFAFTADDSSEEYAKTAFLVILLMRAVYIASGSSQYSVTVLCTMHYNTVFTGLPCLRML